MKVTPLYDRVIIRKLDQDRTTSGLFVPAIAHENSPMGRGEVVAVGDGGVGPGGAIRPLVVKVGDVVWYGRPGSQAIPYDDGPPGSVVITNEPNVIAVLSELPRDTGLQKPDGSPILLAPGEVH